MSADIFKMSSTHITTRMVSSKSLQFFELNNFTLFRMQKVIIHYFIYKRMRKQNTTFSLKWHRAVHNTFLLENLKLQKHYTRIQWFGFPLFTNDIFLRKVILVCIYFLFVANKACTNIAYWLRDTFSRQIIQKLLARNGFLYL